VKDKTSCHLAAVEVTIHVFSRAEVVLYDGQMLTENISAIKTIAERERERERLV
jgi:hypothetical protein